MRLRHVLPALVLLALTSTAHADAGFDYSLSHGDLAPGTGPYIYLSGGAALAYNGCESGWQDYLSAVGATGNCNNKNMIYRFGFGYQFTPMWALEANWGQFGSADQSGFASFSAPVGPGNYAWNMKATGWALQAVATLHMTDHTAMFAKIGVARVEYDEHMDVQPTVLPLPAGYAGWTYVPTVNDKANVTALAAGFQIDTGPHGSIRFAGESYGSHNIYYIYGKDKPVRLVAATISLMWRY